MDPRGDTDPLYVLFWDFDGTLVYSRHLWSQAMCEAVNEAAGTELVGIEEVRPHILIQYLLKKLLEKFLNLKLILKNLL